MSKKVTIIVILVVVVIALYFAMKKPMGDAPAPAQTAVNTGDASTSATQTANVINAIPVDPAVSAIKASGLSDSSLNQDAVAIDSQLKNLSTENKAALQ